MVRFIIKRPVLVSMILVGLCLLGMVSYTKLPVELIPYAELPMLIVQVGAAGDADPEYVEQQAIIPLESAIAGLEDIESIESYVDRQRATIFVYYVQGADLKYGYLKLQERVAAAQADLGNEFIFRVWKIDTEQLTNQFMSLQARGDGSLDQIRKVVDDEVSPVLENIDGVANVQVYGGRQHSIEVLLDEDALRAYQLTATDVSNAISDGAASRQFLGQVTDGKQRLFANLVSEYRSVGNLEEVVLQQQGPVLLRDVATILDGGAEEESVSRVNGQEAISISLMRDQEANLLGLSRTTRDIVSDLNTRLEPMGVNLVIQNDAAESIEDNIEVIKLLALVGGLLAVVVLWIFLKNLPLVLAVAAVIPISVLISLNFFYAFDISINTLTLVGIAIAIGMLLDNSIVILENIHRLMAQGKSVYDAVMNGTGEVVRAVSAATVTTVCVFVPFLYSDSFLVQTLGRHIGVSIISTLLVSLVVAFLLIPAFSYHFLSRGKRHELNRFRHVSQKNRLLQIYTLFLKSCFRYPARTLIIGVVAFFASVILCLAVSINVPDEVELEEFNVYATLPSGTTLEKADDIVIEMDERLSDIAEIEERRATIQEDNADFTFKLVDDYKDIDGREIAEIKDAIVEDLSSAYPAVSFSLEEPVADVRFRGGGGGGGMPGGRFERLLGIGTAEEKVVIRGRDLGLLRTLADEIQFNIDNLETVRRSSVNVRESQPGIDLLVDRAATAYFGITPTQIIAALADFQSENATGVTLNRDGETVNILLKSVDIEDKTSDDLRQLEVPSTTGGLVPITHISQLVYSNGTTNINRVNQGKEVEVNFSFERDVNDSKELLDNARLSVDQIAGSIVPPPGVSIEVVHDEEDYSVFYFLIFASVILIYMILASVFESLATPFIIMFTIPLATIGAFWGLIVTGNSLFNANALIGFLILLGVVVNNGIILIDYSRLLRKRKMSSARALMMAGQARVRPILITTITTVLAMLPLAMGTAEYVARIGAPFAIVVIGGLTLGTLFTLLLIPTMAFGLHNALTWWRELPIGTRAVQLAALTGGALLIYYNVDSFLWQAADFCALLAIVPGLTYFTMTSLRRTSRTIIPADAPITIRIRNAVKLYDDFSRFVREWRKAERQKKNETGSRTEDRAMPVQNLLWHLPLFGFYFYFVYSYLDSGFWQFMLSLGFYMYAMYLASSVLTPDNRTKPRPKLRRRVVRLLFWLLPLANLVWYQMQWDLIALVIIIGILWYLVLLTVNTSRRLYREKVDINRITGKFRRTRKAFYRLVKITPIIGRRRVPFRALNRVSLDISSGMFGLVGPNGAGKTTLMRVICGILDQTRGTVTINDIDLNANREELQALIGYLPQEFGTYENMTAYQFLDYQALLKGIWDASERRTVVNKVIASVHLDSERNSKIGSFSGGMKQRVGIAQTLLHLPRILVVDEPTAGLDPRERIRFRNLLSQLARERVVIFSTHIIEDVSSSCNRLAVLSDGEVKFLGSPADMVEITRGRVWQAELAEAEFEEIRSTMTIVHHMRDGERIRVRILAAEQPLETAIPVTPSLEDSYLWLLRKGAAE